MNAIDKQYRNSILELIDRPIIREDYNEEWLNKMTDVEIDQWYIRTYTISKDNGSIGYPDGNVSYISMHIDTTILYTLFKQANNEQIR